MTFDNLLQQLHVDDAHLRSDAVLALGKLDDSRAVAPLVDVLCGDPDLNVQEDATWSLVRYGENAVDALLTALSNGYVGNASVRHNIVHTLGKLKDSRAASALVELSRDPDDKVRYKAVYALGQIKDTAAIPALIERLGDDVLDIQNTAHKALEAFLNASFGDAAFNALVDALPYGSISQRELVIDLLGSLDDPRVIATLTDTLTDEAWEIRFAVAQALGGIDHPDVKSALTGLLDDDDPRVRAMAQRLMG